MASPLVCKRSIRAGSVSLDRPVMNSAFEKWLEYEASHAGSDRAWLHRRRNDLFLLGPRPPTATLRRRDHLNLRLGHRTIPRISPMTSRSRLR